MTVAGLSIVGAGTTTSAETIAEGGNPGFFTTSDPSWGLIQVGWTVVGHPELGVVNLVNFYPPNSYSVGTTLGTFNYAESFSFQGGSGINITGGLKIGNVPG